MKQSLRERRNRIRRISYTVILCLCVLVLFWQDRQEGKRSGTVDGISTEVEQSGLGFRNERLLSQHYEKHGIEMGFDSPEEYEEAAANVVLNPNALHKKEKEDGDDVYYLEDTNEFVIVSTDGYIRTYLKPDEGERYFNKQ